MLKLLVVEDQVDLAENIFEYLGEESFSLDYAADGLTALHLLATQTYDVVILDLMLPGVNGFEIAGEGRFYPARALIDGNTVLVASKKVPKPSLVRLGWHHLSNTNLQNRAGLPAFPFRTGSSAPEISGKRLFKKSSTITLKAMEGDGNIHYSLDGSLPDKTSPVYTNPIEISKTTAIRARFYRGDGIMSSVAEATFSSAEPRKHGTKTLNLGVRYRYYEGSWAALPDFDTIEAVKTGVADDFNLTMADRADGYALAFTGYLDVREPGLYTFQTTSDDGSALLVDGELVVDNNPLFLPLLMTSVLTPKRSNNPPKEILPPTTPIEPVRVPGWAKIWSQPMEI